MASSPDICKVLLVILVLIPVPALTVRVSPRAIAWEVPLSALIVIVELANLLLAIDPANLALVIPPANIALVIPSAFTLSESELISIEESSTFTAKVLFVVKLPPPDRPSPAVNVKVFKASSSSS